MNDFDNPLPELISIVNKYQGDLEGRANVSNGEMDYFFDQLNINMEHTFK